MHLCPAEACEFVSVCFSPDNKHTSSISQNYLDCVRLSKRSWRWQTLILAKRCIRRQTVGAMEQLRQQWCQHNKYLFLVGTLNGNASSTCRKYEDLNDGKSPSWTVDNSQTKLKKHILCWMDPNKLSEEAVVSKGMDSIWLDESHGWNGGSYSDGEQFWEGLGGKKLCPYTACKWFALTFKADPQMCVCWSPNWNKLYSETGSPHTGIFLSLCPFPYGHHHMEMVIPLW